ncbi:MAG: hypothetical protein WDM78_00255 [Puia sp.]
MVESSDAAAKTDSAVSTVVDSAKKVVDSTASKVDSTIKAVADTAKSAIKTVADSAKKAARRNKCMSEMNPALVAGFFLPCTPQSGIDSIFGPAILQDVFSYTILLLVGLFEFDVTVHSIGGNKILDRLWR